MFKWSYNLVTNEVNNFQKKLAIKFFSDLLRSWVWGWCDVRNRYRRSTFGPFWETINIAVLIGGMAIISGALFNINTLSILPYLGLGVIFWTVISNSISDGADCFISNSVYLQNSNMGIGLFVGRTIFRIYITSAHHLILFALAVFALPIQINYNSMLIIPGITLLFLNSVWVIGVLGLICARYRDMKMIVKNLTQLLFFVTPIFWSAEFIPERKRFILDFNPLYYYLEIVRAPLLGKTPPLQIYLVTGALTILGFSLFY